MGEITSDVSILFHWSLSVFVPLPHCVDYHCLVLKSEILISPVKFYSSRWFGWPGAIVQLINTLSSKFWDPIWMLVIVPEVPFPLLPPTCSLGKHGRMIQSFGTLKPCGIPEISSLYQALNQLSSSHCCFLGSNSAHWRSFSVSPLPCNSAFSINIRVKIFLLLVHSSSIHSSSNWANLNPGARSSFQISQMAAECKGFGQFSNAFQSLKERNWWKFEQPGYEPVLI